MRVSLGNAGEEPASCGEIAWEEVFRIAEQHHVLPMAVDAAYKTYGHDIPWTFLLPFKRRAQRMTYLQTVKTERFLSIYRYLSERGLAPVVMKGLVCRELYPEPDFRFSADEDLLIPPDEAAAYHKALLAYGLRTDSPEPSAASAQEVSYRSDDGILLLEIHRFAFPPDSGAYGEYNAYFAGALDRAVTISAAGTELRTMDPTDHLFYLLCHALKHFMHGGFGIRQVMDIGLFANAYAEQIDWPRLLVQVEAVRAKEFTASLFAIAGTDLGISLRKIPEGLRKCGRDPRALLDDILESGVYGSSTMSRKHSASITLRAAENAGSGMAGKRHSRIRILFPKRSDMEKRFPYLKKCPWLLPAAWLQRISRYVREHGRTNSPKETLRIGRERVSLMKTYGLLTEPSAKKVDTEQYLTALSELIGQGHEVSIPVAGSSMTPFLGDGRDQVFVKAPERPVRRGDIVLYRRKDGTFVLHRVYRVHGKGEEAAYDIIGDAQDQIERGVRSSSIIAVATRARRKGKLIEPGSFYWWFFQFIWIRMIPVRRHLMRLYTRLHMEHKRNT